MTAGLAARVNQHRTETESGSCTRYGLVRLVWAERGESIAECIAPEKRPKRWRRDWKFDLIERGNPRLALSVRVDRLTLLQEEAGPWLKAGVTVVVMVREYPQLEL